MEEEEKGGQGTKNQVAWIAYNATSCLGTCGQEDGRMHDAMRRVEG